jgi:mannose-1-phosphate guanylyltransferase
VFPRLVGNGLYGFSGSAYWLDIGTPDRYLQGTYDILEGNVSTQVGRLLKGSGARVEDGQVDGRVVAPALVGPGCEVAAGAIVGGRTVLGSGVHVGEGAHIEGSALLDGASVGARTIVRSAIIGPGVTIGDHCHIEDGVVLGQGVTVGSDNVLRAGARIFPGVQLPDGAIKF